jgi:hypothetical protein
MVKDDGHDNQVDVGRWQNAIGTADVKLLETYRPRAFLLAGVAAGL